MQNIPNGGRPLRFIRFGRPFIKPVPVPVLLPAPAPLPAPAYSESFQEVVIPEIKSYVREKPLK
jgi:hypothetical protein